VTLDTERASRVAGWSAIAILVVATWAALDKTINRGLPVGIVLQGVVFGSLYALVAIGIVLVYRANRVVNFAQAEFGSVAAVLAIEFVLQLNMNYFLAVFLGLVIATASGGLLEIGILRRFRRAPRLIVMVVTIGLAQILAGVATLIPVLWSGLSTRQFKTPWKVHFEVFPVRFDGNYMFAIIVVPIVVAALAAFLRFSNYGVAIRASAENGDRAELLGIPVRRLSTLVWAIAGFLSALAVLLRVPILGFASFTNVSGGGPSLLLRALCAAVIGGMTSLPITAGAAVAIGVADALGAWHFHNGDYVNAMLLGVVLIALLVRREKFSRSFETGIGAFRAIQEVRPVPAELARLPEVRWGSRGLQLLVLAAALAYPIFTRPSQQQLAAVVAIYAMVAI
jgi:branched-chain amino acid transport system permease protein